MCILIGGESYLLERRRSGKGLPLSYPAEIMLEEAMGLDLNTEKLRPEGPIALVSRKMVIEAVIEKLKDICVIATINDVETVFDEVQKEFQKK